MSWTPTPSLVHGRIVKCFLPLDNPSFDKKDKSLLKNFTNVYPGDEIFIFEYFSDKTWARGYVTSKPVPADFFEANVNIEKIVEIKTSIAIVPSANIRILKTIDQNSLETDTTTSGGNTSGVSDVDDSDLFDDAENVFDSDTKKKKSVRPPFPYNHFRSKTFNDEIIFALNSLTVHIYTFYANNDFENFNKMCEIYRELDNIRIQLNEDLLTKYESKLARKRTVVLIGKIAKLLASFERKQKKDVAGYKAIMSRNVDDEELSTYQISSKQSFKFNNPAVLSSRQLLLSLFPNYPVTEPVDSTLIPEKNSRLTSFAPSHVLIDFKSVSGSSSVLPNGYNGMTAYMYIRNNKKRLTEAFAITIKKGQDFLLDNLSAALYMNIPASDVDSGRIYLVALLTEDIMNENDEPKSSNSPKKKLEHVRKGIAAGVVDISRIFSRNKGSLASGESHQFSIKLFGSYMNESNDSSSSTPTISPGMNAMTAMSLLMPNNGWGELIDRIISGSSKGIAINPRAEKLTVSIKEFKKKLYSEDGNDMDGSQNILETSRAISVIKSMQYDPLDKSYERVYIRALKINVNGKFPSNSYFTIHMSSSNNLLKFNKGTNQEPSQVWRFLSVAEGEVINELLQVTGFQCNPKVAEDKDFLVFQLYANSELIGEGKYQIRNGTLINDFKKGRNIDIYSNGGNVKVGSFEIETEYCGTLYNIDQDIVLFNNWKSSYSKVTSETENVLLPILVKFNKVEANSTAKYFEESLFNLLEMFALANMKNMGSLKSAVFDSIVHLLDVVIARQDQFVILFEGFINNHSKSKDLPSVGAQLLSDFSRFFSKASSEWNQIGRALCRISILIIKLANICKSDADLNEFNLSFHLLAKSTASFLAIDKESFVSDQLLVIEVLEQWLDVFHSSIKSQDLLNYVIMWFNSIGTRGLGSITDSESTALVNKKKAREHKIITTKLILIRRLLHGRLIKNEETREKLINNAIQYAMEVLTTDPLYDIDAVRLANSILLSVCSTGFGEDKIYFEKSKSLQITLGSLMPTLSMSFNKLNRLCKTNGILDPRRTFTQLFPTIYPFVEYTMDSVIREESFAEVLLEMGTVICYIAKITQSASNEIHDIFGDVSQFVETKGKASASNGEGSTLFSLIQTVKILTLSKFYPSEKWLSVKSLFIDGSMTMLELLFPILVKLKIPEVQDSAYFDREIWGNYLKSILRCSTSSVSSIEHLNDIAKKGCLKITGDIRSRGAKLLEKSWDALAWDSLPDDIVRFHLRRFGGHQVEFITNSNGVGITQDLLLFCMQRHETCVDVGMQILWSIIISEWLISENLFEVEKECIVGLYAIFHNEFQYTPDNLEINEFINKLKAVISLDKEDESYPHVIRLVNTLSGFLSSLCELKKIPFGDEFDDDRTFHKIHMSGYLMNVNKPEIFHEFINDMYENNLAKKNYIQAALSMELLADTYEWDTNIMLSPISTPKLPQQSSFERKEYLYKIIASNFIKGNKYEQAVDLYQELLDVYYKKNFDLNGLSYCHGKLSQIYSALETVDRLESTFFKISFIGFGFPVSIRGKEFIYEGLVFEHITSIHHRLSRLYPGSKILSSEEDANKLLSNPPLGRYLYIKTVTPQKQQTSTVGNSDVLTKSAFMTQRYVDNKNLNTFVSIRRLPGSSGIEDLWSEETTYETYLTFPTLMNRSEIRASNVVKISPTLNALRTINDKNEDLANVEFLVLKAIREATNIEGISSSSLFNDFSRQLSGTVDSPVNGGVGQYRVFYSKLEENAETDESVVSSEDYQQRLAIKTAFSDMVVLLNRCLQLHGKLIPSTLKASHKSLVDLFRKNFQKEITELNLSQDQQIDLSSAPMYMVGVSHQSHGQFNLQHKRNRSSHYASTIGSSSIHNGSYAESTYSDSNLTLQKTISNSSNTSSIDNASSRYSSDNSSFSNSYNNSKTVSVNSKRTALNWKDRF